MIVQMKMRGCTMGPMDSRASPRTQDHSIASSSSSDLQYVPLVNSESDERLPSVRTETDDRV